MTDKGKDVFDPTSPVYPWGMNIDWDAKKVLFYSDGELRETLAFSDAYSGPDNSHKDLARFFIKNGRFEVEMPGAKDA